MLRSRGQPAHHRGAGAVRVPGRSPEVIQARLSGKTDRPLFQSPEQLAQLFAERASFYKMASARAALSGAESLEEASDRVLMALDRSETLID